MASSMPSILLNSGQTSEDRNMRYFPDASLLDCPICMEPFSPPVYQCANGHSICSSCCQKIPEQKCPSCSQPTGQIRSLMVEKIMESLQVPCKYAPDGCKEMLQYSKRTEGRRHEDERCMYVPLHCAYPLCERTCSSFVLPAHLEKAHGVQTMHLDPRRCAKFRFSNYSYMNRVVLVELGHGGLMLVHREPHDLGDVFFCSTIIGTSQVYNLKVKCTAETSFYTIEASAPYIQKILSIQKVVEKSCVPYKRLLILVDDVSKHREYDVEVEVRGP